VRLEGGWELFHDDLSSVIPSPRGRRAE
jgi:hypothetical protein